MNISELSYLEVVEETGIAGAGGVYFDSVVKKDVDLDKDVYLDVDKYVHSKVDLKGNLATAEASADAYGKDTLAEADTFAQTTDYSSEAYSEALAATY